MSPVENMAEKQLAKFSTTRVNKVATVLVGTLRFQQSLKKAQKTGTKFSIERTQDWRYRVKADNLVIGDVPAIMNKAFAYAERIGLWVAVSDVKIISAPPSIADMRSAAFCLFDDDDEEEASEKLTALVAFTVAPRDKLLAP